MCEAYGGWPSERMGILDKSNPATFIVALAFDMDVLATSRRRRQAAYEGRAAGVTKSVPERIADVVAKLPEGSALRKQLEERIGG